MTGRGCRWFAFAFRFSWNSWMFFWNDIQRHASRMRCNPRTSLHIFRYKSFARAVVARDRRKWIVCDYYNVHILAEQMRVCLCWWWMCEISYAAAVVSQHLLQLSDEGTPCTGAEQRVRVRKKIRRDKNVRIFDEKFVTECSAATLSSREPNSINVGNLIFLAGEWKLVELHFSRLNKSIVVFGLIQQLKEKGSDHRCFLQFRILWGNFRNIRQHFPNPTAYQCIGLQVHSLLLRRFCPPTEAALKLGKPKRFRRSKFQSRNYDIGWTSACCLSNEDHDDMHKSFTTEHSSRDFRRQEIQ